MFRFVGLPCHGLRLPQDSRRTHPVSYHRDANTLRLDSTRPGAWPRCPAAISLAGGCTSCRAAFACSNVTAKPRRAGSVLLPVRSLRHSAESSQTTSALNVQLGPEDMSSPCMGTTALHPTPRLLLGPQDVTTAPLLRSSDASRNVASTPCTLAPCGGPRSCSFCSIRRKLLKAPDATQFPQSGLSKKPSAACKGR